MFGNLDSRDIQSIQSIYGMMFIIYNKKLIVFNMFSHKKINLIYLNFKNVFDSKVINQSLVLFHQSNCSIIKFKNNKIELSHLFNLNSINICQSFSKYFKNNDENNILDFSIEY